jgi:hypothetical protein
MMLIGYFFFASAVPCWRQPAVFVIQLSTFNTLQQRINQSIQDFTSVGVM